MPPLFACFNRNGQENILPYRGAAAILSYHMKLNNSR